ncbi:Anhydro-N-acetylmuramic acid kinase [Stackebrandtia soli]
MSGTSYDGIDVASADIDRDGDTLTLRPLGAFTLPHPDRVRDLVTSVLPPRSTTVAAITELDTALGQAFADAAKRAIAEHADGQADLIVSHGQTVFHWVEDGRALGTLQLGQPAWIAEATNTPVLSDLRSADIAAGGQGAPLVPIFDALLLPRTDEPRAALNLGGIANLTVIPPDGPILGYDVGPANALIDAASLALLGDPFDRDGAVAAAGTVDADLLRLLLSEPYYNRPAPKSTGKELFNDAYLTAHISTSPAAGRPADVIATVTELAAVTIARESDQHDVSALIASGGGTHNSTLMARLRHHLDEGRTLSTIDEFGIGVDEKEAYAFAVLGYLSWHGIPGVIESVTGADAASVLGRLTMTPTTPRPPAEAFTPPSELRIV